MFVESIDLTEDGDEDGDEDGLEGEQQQVSELHHSPPRSKLSTFFSNLTHRTPSSSVPSKRKSDSDSKENVPSANLFLPNGDDTTTTTTTALMTDSRTVKKPSSASRNLTTPSPSPGSQDKQQRAVNVVIPSPSRKLKKEILSSEWTPRDEFTGLSETYYPTDRHEQRAHKGAYPRARDKVDRRAVSLGIGLPTTTPILTERAAPPIRQQLYRSFVRKLSKIQGPPVTLASGDDDHLLTGIAANFEFVNEYKLRKGVQPVGEDFNAGCSCTTVCDPKRCMCLSEAEDTDEKLLPYQAAPDDASMLVLSSEFRERTSMIFECSARCGCKGKCWNNVVQRGRTVRFEIFHTGNRGFGLRSPDFIRAGQFIDVYLGEVITLQTATVRGNLAAAEHAHCYLFDLDFLLDDDSIYVIDGQKLGSPTRFMNHSCNPNCRMFPVSRNHGDNRLYDLAFFSLCDIAPMTELTFDYNPGSMESNENEGGDSDSDSDSDGDYDNRRQRRKDKNKSTLKANSNNPNVVKCLCGEANCRGQLWTTQRKGTK